MSGFLEFLRLAAGWSLFLYGVLMAMAFLGSFIEPSGTEKAGLEEAPLLTLFAGFTSVIALVGFYILTF